MASQLHKFAVVSTPWGVVLLRNLPFNDRNPRKKNAFFFETPIFFGDIFDHTPNMNKKICNKWEARM